MFCQSSLSVKKIQRELTCPMCHSKWEQTFVTVILSVTWLSGNTITETKTFVRLVKLAW